MTHNTREGIDVPMYAESFHSRLAYVWQDKEATRNEIELTLEGILRQELQKARKEAYEHAEIVRQRMLNDIVDMLDEVGDVQGARAVEAMYQSELDQPTELFNTIKKDWVKQAEDLINGDHTNITNNKTDK